jgi:hypothetical protein
VLFPEQLGPIRDFVAGLGIGCRPGTVPDDSFLPGVALAEGALLYDERRLGSPGDLLHEAGHVALVPARFRPLLDDDVDAAIARIAEGAAPPGAAPAEEPERELLGKTEIMAIAWSFAAARASGATLDCLFWPGTYRMPAGQRPDALVQQIEMGLFPGLHWLARFGFCALPPPFGDPAEPRPFPAMKRWLAD